MSFVPLKVPAYRQITDARCEMEIANLRHLPVVDGDGLLIGIISDRDIWRGLAGGAHPSDPVETIMTRRVAAVTPGTTILDALDIMLERKIGALPVEGTGEQVVGIVTETDLLVLLRALIAGSPPPRLVAEI